MEPGDRLKLLIRASGKTQRQLAQDMKEHPMWVTNRVTGHSQINIQDVPRMAAPLGWDDCQLFLALIGERDVYPSLGTKPDGKGASREPRPAPDYGDDIYRRAKDKLGRSELDAVIRRFLDFLETDETP